MQIVDKGQKRLSGILLAVLVAIAARLMADILPVDFIGANVLAIFTGVLVNSIFSIQNTPFESGVQFTTKRILKLSIILLGGSLNIATILEVGQQTLLVLFFTLSTAFGGGFLLGKLLGLDWKFTSLISSGAGICGGTAISAVAPVIEAENHQVSYAISNIFLFDMFMILFFPIIGRLLNMSNMVFGLWAGTAINDTSSVVAAGYAFSEQAGDFATMVKLTRTLAIVPVVLIFTALQIWKNKKTTEESQSEVVEMNLLSVFPWFIFGFLILVAINSAGFIPAALSVLLKDISSFLMVVALAAIGLRTDVGAMKQSGLKPMIHAVSTSLLVAIVSISVLAFFGIY